MKDIIEDTKKKLEDYIVRYRELISKIPEYTELKREIPQDLLENYRRLTIKVKEMGIPEKLKRGEKLTFKEQLVWLNWKNLHTTVKFITGENTKIWDQIRELNDNYQNLIDICQNNLLQLEYIGQHFDNFIKLAEGVRVLLDMLSKMPIEMIDMSALLMNLQGIIMSFGQLFEFCTTNALRLDEAVDVKNEILKDLSKNYAKMLNNVKDTINKAKESGYECSELEAMAEEIEIVYRKFTQEAMQT
jgi:DNA-binding ferritin-like protein